MALALSVLSGIGGLCYQTDDHWGHNVKLFELFTSPWPLHSPANGPVISYYFGYYVVPALFFKLTGHIQVGVMVIWTAAGFAIGMAWIYLVLNKKLLLVFLTLCVGDFPRVLRCFLSFFHIRLYEFGDFGVEHWSVLENIFWAPNQVIPALIIGGMIMHSIRNKHEIERLYFPLSLTFWWAVFPTFFGCIFLAFITIKKSNNLLGKVFSFSYLKNVYLPGLYMLLMILFFSSHKSTPVSGYLWKFSDSGIDYAIEYISNILLNTAIFIFTYLTLIKLNRPKLSSFTFLIALLIIVISALYRLGKANDILTRGMMPVFIVAGIHLLFPLSVNRKYLNIERSKTGHLLALVIVLFSITSIFGISRIGRALHYNQITATLFPDRIKFAPLPYDQYKNIHDVLVDRWSELEARQYMGDIQSFYQKKIAPENPELPE